MRCMRTTQFAIACLGVWISRVQNLTINTRRRCSSHPSRSADPWRSQRAACSPQRVMWTSHATDLAEWRKWDSNATCFRTCSLSGRWQSTATSPKWGKLNIATSKGSTYPSSGSFWRLQASTSCRTGIPLSRSSSRVPAAERYLWTRSSALSQVVATTWMSKARTSAREKDKSPSPTVSTRLDAMVQDPGDHQSKWQKSAKGEPRQNTVMLCHEWYKWMAQMELDGLTCVPFQHRSDRCVA